MVKQFKIILISITNGIKFHLVNCNDEISAKLITETIFPNMRIIDITEEEDKK